MPDDADKVRAELRKLGKRRERQGQAARKLAAETAAAVRRARQAKVPVTETARLIGLERSSIYHTYGDG